MSEIFAPGSGAAGPAGPPATFLGAYNSGTTYTTGQAVSSAGSSYVSMTNGNVGNAPATSPSQWGLLAAAGTGGGATTATLTSLEASLRPTPVNLFNATAVQTNYTTNSTGTLTYQAPGSVGGGPPIATGLIYCPGATGLISNATLGTAGFGSVGAYIQLFDANGNFIGNATDPGSYHFDPGNVLTLPGTQVYVRVTFASTVGSNPALAATMICAGVSPTLPSAYVSFAPDVSSVTQTKIAAGFNNGIVGWSESVINPSANLLNWAAAQLNCVTNNDGSVSSAPGRGEGPAIVTNYLHCPGATEIVSNWPIFNDSTLCYVQLFDSLMNFIGLATNATSGNYTAPGSPITLPGTQTYVRLTFASGAPGYPGNINKAMVCVGASLPAAYVPFVGAPTNTTVRKASELGAYLDANLLTGLTSTGYTAHDDTAVLNAFLATASVNNPIKLILDGVAATTGLLISPNGYTTIEGIGWQSGIFIINGARQDGICIGGYGAGVPWVNGEGDYNIALPSRTAINITLRDFTINGNGDNVYSPGSSYVVPANVPVEGAPAHNIHGVLLANCSFVLLDHLQIIEPPNSSIKLSNVDHVIVRDCRDNTGGTVHDCLHVDGPAEDLIFSGCTFEGLDDGIALNGPEGYGGDISRVTVSDCIFLGCDTLMRIYTSLTTEVMPTNNVHKARQVVITNCVGNVKLCVLSLGIAGGSGYNSTTDVDQIEDLLIENCNLAVTVTGYGWIFLEDTAGLIQVRGCVYRSPTIAAVPFINSISNSVGQFILSDCTILRNGDGSENPAFFVSAGTGATGKLTLSGVRVLDEVGSSYTAIPAALSIGRPLAELVIHSIDMDHITALFDSNGTTNVTLARGSGLLGTGAQIADATVDNNAFYLSSNASGAPSIKVGGTAKRLTLA